LVTCGETYPPKNLFGNKILLIFSINLVKFNKSLISTQTITQIFKDRQSTLLTKIGCLEEKWFIYTLPKYRTSATVRLGPGNGTTLRAGPEGGQAGRSP
jgi:hypothetical protein